MNVTKAFFICALLFGQRVALADQNKAPTLPDLINLEKQVVDTYSAYKFEVNWIDGQPSIDILKEIVNEKTRKLDGGLIVKVEAGKSKSSILQNIGVLNSLSTFKPAKVTVTESKISDDEDKTLSWRFDSYDAKGHLRHSEWRNSKNGFKVEEILFKEDGKPLNMAFYYKLQINRATKPFVTDVFTTLTLDQVTKRFGTFNYSNIDEVIEICIKTLHRAKEMRGMLQDEE